MAKLKITYIWLRRKIDPFLSSSIYRQAAVKGLTISRFVPSGCTLSRKHGLAAFVIFISDKKNCLKEPCLFV